MASSGRSLKIDITCARRCTNQIPISKWHDLLGAPSIAGDAILDRLVHNAYKLQLKGPSKITGEAKKN
ncbi:MAG: ATP-binding protein [Myxococcota bacterium]